MTANKNETSHVILMLSIPGVIAASLVLFFNWLTSSSPPQCPKQIPCPVPQPAPLINKQRFFDVNAFPFMIPLAFVCFVMAFPASWYMFTRRNGRALATIISIVPLLVLWSRAGCNFASDCFWAAYPGQLWIFQWIFLSVIGTLWFYFTNEMDQMFELSPVRWVLFTGLVATYVLWLVDAPPK